MNFIGPWLRWGAHIKLEERCRFGIAHVFLEDYYGSGIAYEI